MAPIGGGTAAHTNKTKSVEFNSDFCSSSSLSWVARSFAHIAESFDQLMMLYNKCEGQKIGADVRKIDDGIAKDDRK